MTTVNGRDLAEKIYEVLRERVVGLTHKPKLALVKTGSDAVTESYVAIKKRAAEKIGAEFIEVVCEESTEEGVVEKINNCSQDGSVHGIVVQLPLPQAFDTEKVLSHILPKKDIDTLGGRSIFTSPIVLAVEEILKTYDVVLEDKSIVVVGRGRLVGKPIVAWLEKEGVTPVVLDELSANSREELMRADIIISGAGSPQFIKPDMIKEGVVLIDAGTSEQGGAIVGDVDPACEEKASIFTPVPGGVGPIVVAKLFENLVEASR